MKGRTTYKIPLIIPALCIIMELMTGSCSEDSNESFTRPVIKFTTSAGYLHSDTSLTMNETVRIGIEASTGSNGNLTHLHTRIDRNGEVVKLDSGMHTSVLEISRLITKSLAETETWSFYVRDIAGRQSDTISLTLDLKTGSQFESILRFDTIRLGAQKNDTEGNLLSLPSGLTLSFTDGSEAPEDIWLLYYYDNLGSDRHSIASPGASIDASIYDLSGWSKRNTSRFFANGTVGEDAFREASNDSLILANSFDFESGKRKAKKLNTGDIYSFATENGMKGMLIISGVDGTEDGWVEFELILQEK